MRCIMLMVAASLVLTGCSDAGRPVENIAVDREELLIGRWQGKDVVPGEAAGVVARTWDGKKLDLRETARQMAASVHIELKRDKTFVAERGGETARGEFTFNEETSEVVLKVLHVKIVPEDPGRHEDLSWTAYLNDDNKHLVLYSIPPADVAKLRQGKFPEASLVGIKLGKKANVDGDTAR